MISPPPLERECVRCRKLGVTLSLDDFGTGYSSLAYLQHLPFDQLKNRPVFISGMTEHSSNKAIVKAILAMGQRWTWTSLPRAWKLPSNSRHSKREGCRGFQGYAC